MKWLFIFFLLANVIYFGWELDRQTKMDISYTASMPRLTPGTRRLQFLEELETPPPLRNTEVENPLETFPDLAMPPQEQEQIEDLAALDTDSEDSTFNSFMPEFEAEHTLLPN